jgi:hypothetical protein
LLIGESLPMPSVGVLSCGDDGTTETSKADASNTGASGWRVQRLPRRYGEGGLLESL